jgi:outer membrane receptor protein involved in Fe transport
MVGCLAVLAANSLEAQSGQVNGRVIDDQGHGVPGVLVTIEQADVSAITDPAGDFSVKVAPGLYSISFALGDATSRVEDVEVLPHGSTRTDWSVDWTPGAGGGVATAPALRVEPRSEASAAVSIVDRAAIASQASQGQLPRLFEHAPVANLAQSALWDFSLGGRSFNDFGARRVALRLDGRDPSMLFFGGQEWSALALTLDDYVQAELVHGPMSALYADAPGGVASLLTSPLRGSRGGTLRLTGGEAGTTQGDLRWVFALGPDSHLKLAGSYREAEPFSLSRNQTAEYSQLCSSPFEKNCLPAEAVPLDRSSDDEVTTGSVRWDHFFEKGALLRLEGGASDISGPLMLTDIGRVQILDSRWEWGRADLSSIHYDIRYHYRNRDADKQTALSTGNNVGLDEESWKIAARTSWSLSDKVDFLAGLSHEDDRVDTLGDENLPNRRSTFNPLDREGSLLFERVQDEADAGFFQFDIDPTPKLALVLGARWDDSSYYEPQWSPRASLIADVGSGDSLRVSFSQGFQRPSYGERFLQFDMAPEVNLATVEPMCAFHGTRCGFDFDEPITVGDAPNDTTPDTRNLALGNEALDVQKTSTLELGYRGDVGGDVFFSFDVHASQHEDFIVMLPQLGTSLGRTNPAYVAYMVPDTIPRALEPGEEGPIAEDITNELQRLLGEQYDYLSMNIVDGTPILAMASYTNLGEVDTLGADISIDWLIDGSWKLLFAYSFLDSDVSSTQPGLDDYLLPNTPEHRSDLGFTYTASSWNGQLRYRWSDSFRWVSGPFAGDVDSFGSLDLLANVRLSDRVSLGISVQNALDEEHNQTFGGDLLERRGMANVTIDW